MLNPEIAYLLGMIVGKGEIVRGNTETRVIISIPHKNLTMEDQNTQLSVKASLLDIVGRLNPLIGADLTADTANANVAVLYFSKPNEDYLIRTLNSYLRNIISWRQSRIPNEIFEGNNTGIKKEFLRGVADVTGHIRKSNLAYGQSYNHRVYLEIMDNWDLTIDIANLLKSLNIPVQTIRFAHPNLVDTSGKDYARGVRSYKEHQIKIWAEEFEKVGFNVDHKNSLLQKYARINRDNWDKKTSVQRSHHKFYWQTRKIKKSKPRHPDEKNPRIHPKIRGKHFDSWKEIAKELGYHE